MSSSLKRVTTVLTALLVFAGGAVALPAVASAATSGTLSITNLDTVPSNSRIVLNRIQTPADASQRFHDKATVRLKNTASSTLTVSAISAGAPFTATSPWKLPFKLTSGNWVDITVQFTAQSGAWYAGNLAVTSTSSTGATSNVALAGYWQRYSEHNLEPSLASLVSHFGYTTAMPTSSYSRGAYVAASPDEVLSPYWTLLNAGSAKVTELAAWHGYPNSGTFRTFPKGAPANYTTRLVSLNVDAQSALPRNSAWGKGTATFQPTGTFGLILDQEYSDPKLNNQAPDRAVGCTAAQCGQHVRVFKVRNSAGVVAGSYVVTVDILGINYDYQDDVFLVENIKPAA